MSARTPGAQLTLYFILFMLFFPVPLCSLFFALFSIFLYSPFLHRSPLHSACARRT